MHKCRDLHAANTAKGEWVYAIENCLGGISRRGWAVFLDAFNRRHKIGRMLPLSTESSSRVKQPLDAIPHLLILNSLAAIGLLDAPLYPSDKPGLIFKHAIDCFFHQLLGILSVRRGHLLKPCFNVGREMYFHIPKVGISWVGVNY